MLLQLQPFDFRIKYVPGKELKISDALSRLPTEDTPSSGTTTVTSQLEVDLVYFSATRKEAMQQATEADQDLQALSTHIVQGFPSSIKELPERNRPYWSVRDTLSVQDGIILRGTQVVVPLSERKAILEALHQPHLGVNNTLLRAKSTVWWPNIRQDIEKLIQTCQVCQETRNAPAQQELQTHETPTRVWQKVGLDLFQVAGRHFICVVDYRSKFPFVHACSSIPTGEKVIQYLKRLFSEHGIPQTVVSDNGPQFGASFKGFASTYGFTHLTSAPQNHRCNGQVERTIQTVKHILQKAEEPYQALLAWRTKPINASLPSPAELMFRHTVRSNLPVAAVEDLHQDQLTAELQLRAQHMQQQSFTRSPRTFSVDDRVWIYHEKPKHWTKGVIKKKNSDRNYILTDLDTGRVIGRDSGHLRARKDAQQPPPV
jgi:hypothetical protein